MVELIKAFMTQDEEGQGLFEYALILVRGPIVEFAALGHIGGRVTGLRRNFRRPWVGRVCWIRGPIPGRWADPLMFSVVVASSIDPR